MEKKKKPIAVCTNCGSYAYDPSLINNSCRNVIARKRCSGSFGSALAQDDWKECVACIGSGQESEAPCSRCRGYGWDFIRRNY